MQNLILVFAAFFSAERGIYSQKLKNQDPGNVGGANAPPTESVWPQKCGLGHVSAALVWPHQRGGGPLFEVGLASPAGFLVAASTTD